MDEEEVFLVSSGWAVLYLAAYGFFFIVVMCCLGARPKRHE